MYWGFIITIIGQVLGTAGRLLGVVAIAAIGGCCGLANLVIWITGFWALYDKNFQEYVNRPNNKETMSQAMGLFWFFQWFPVIMCGVGCFCTCAAVAFAKRG